MRTHGLYQRGHVWYWRVQLAGPKKIKIPTAKPCRASEKVRKHYGVDISVSLFARDRNANVELAGRLSTLVNEWIARAKMLGILEEMRVEEIRALTSWALADLRDLYCTRIPIPRSADPGIVEGLARKLEAEAIAFQLALDTGDLEIVEGPARAILRRRGIAADINGQRFQEFLRLVTPSLLDARKAELMRLRAAHSISTGAAATLTRISNAPSASEVSMLTADAPPDRPPAIGIGSKPAAAYARVYRIEDALEDLLRTAHREGRLSQKTRVQYRQSAELLIRVLGDLPIAEITREMAAEFRETVLALPRKYGQSARYADLRIPEIIERANELREEKRVMPTTWNRHHTALFAIFEDAKLTGKIERNPLDGLRYRRAKKSSDGHAVHETRAPFGAANLEKFFGSPLFTGFRSSQFRHQPGRRIRHDAHFWLPVLMLALGARSEEIAQIKLSDFGVIDGIDILRITSEGGRSVKSRSANRTLPITSQLKELGFLRFVDDRRAAGADFLFEDCIPTGTLKRRSTVIGKALNRYIRRIGIADPKIVLYSARHDFASILAESGVDPRLVARLMGHSTGQIAFDTYSSKLERALFDALDRVKFPALTLVAPYIRTEKSDGKSPVSVRQCRVLSASHTTCETTNSSTREI